MDSEVRDSVIARDRGLCIWCSAVGGEIHHRRVKGMGGGSIDLDTPANLAVLCSHDHHDRVHRHPAWARHVGLIVSRHSDVPTEPFVREPWMPTVEQYERGMLDADLTRPW